MEHNDEQETPVQEQMADLAAIWLKEAEEEDKKLLKPESETDLSQPLSQTKE